MTMNRRRFLLTSATTMAAGVLPASRARADAVDDVLARITKARAGVQTLRARFTQKRVIGLLATAVESKGALTLVRPDRLRWELFPPDEVVYWVGPDGLAIRNEEGVTRVSKVAAGRFAAVLGDLMIMLGGDVAKLRNRYELSVRESAAGVRLSATPKVADVAKHIRRIKLLSTKELWAASRVTISETNGDSSVIDFGTFERNIVVPPAVMTPS